MPHTNFNDNRRKLLVWSIPTIVAVHLPAHAQTSFPEPDVPEPDVPEPDVPEPDVPEPEVPEPPMECAVTAPTIIVPEAPKCAGDPPIGEADIEISASDDSPLIITNITFSSSSTDASIANLPSFPTTLSDTQVLSITWRGPASDGVSCGPISTDTLTISYTCEGNTQADESQTYDITSALLDSIT